VTEARDDGEPPGSDVGDRRIARFERLYREQFPFVWGVARSLGVWDAALPDVVQEVFITAYRRLDGLDPELSPRGWLYTVTRRVVHRVRRTAARTARREAALRRLPELRDEPHARDEAAVDLAGLLAALDDTQREVFVMADLLGMSGPEMAAQTGVPLDTVYSRLRLARGRLQRLARAGTIERAIDHARRPPEAAQSRRSWAALLIALPRPLAIGATLGLGKLAIAGGLAIVTTLVIAARRGTDVSAADRPQAAEVPREAPTPALDPATPPLPAAILDPTPMPEPPRPVAPASAESRRATASPLPTAPPSGIDAELAALERADAELARGQPAAALAVVDGDTPRHAELADVRGSLRVRALCELGHGDAARSELARLRSDHPASHVVRRARCDPR
jgi:RNA polymerase sigma factor (sigma-70 family)